MIHNFPLTASNLPPQLFTLTRLAAGHADPCAVKTRDWPEIIALAFQHSLAPMLFWRIRQAGLNIEKFPEWEPLAASAYRAAAHHVVLRKTQAEVDAALRSEDIPALWLKGIVLATTAYPKPWLRPMVDLDVLVPFRQRDAALETLTRIGFNAASYASFRQNGQHLGLEHHYVLSGGIAGVTSVELHFKLLGWKAQKFLPPRQLAWFWEQTITWSENEATSFTALRPEAHLLYLCAHIILQHGESAVPFSRFLDLHQLILKQHIDWNCVVGQAAILGWAAAVRRALEVTVQYFATPVPNWIFDALHNHHSDHKSDLTVEMLADKGRRWEHVRLALTTLTLRQALHFILRILAPGPLYMRQRYSIPSGRYTWPYYLYRWFDQSREVGWWLWNYLRRGSH